MDWGLVDFVMFLSAVSVWRHPFTAEDPWWGSNFSKPVPMKKQAHLHLGWPAGEYILIFGLTIPLYWKQIEMFAEMSWFLNISPQDPTNLKSTEQC